MMQFSLAVISDRLQALTRALDADPDLPGQLLIYGGERPAPGQDQVAPLMLATFLLTKPSLFRVEKSTLTLIPPKAILVRLSGVATWARLVSGAGQWVADMDVGLMGSQAECIIQGKTLQLYAGGELSVSVASLVES